MSALTLYHGTSGELEASIGEEGLRSPCLTDCYETAAYYAEAACDVLGGEPLVYEIELAAEGSLTVDLPGIEEPVLRGPLRDAVKARARAADSSTEEAVWAHASELAPAGWAQLTGRQSLAVAGSACHQGVVPGDQLLAV